MLKILTMHIRMTRNIIEKVLFRVIRRAENTPLCNCIRPGIFGCNNGKYVIALYKVRYWATEIHTLSQLDYIYSLKKFLDVFQVENCRLIFLADIEPLDVNSYMSKLDNKLQMKLIELEMDKTNVKLQNYVRKLIETKKKILMGIKPVRIVNIVALICDDNVNLKNIDKVVMNAKNMLNIDLDPLIEQKYAEAIVNFC